MQILVALTVGLVVWIVLWSLGAKSFDGFMITPLLVIVAVVVWLAQPFVRDRLRP